MTEPGRRWILIGAVAMVSIVVAAGVPSVLRWTGAFRIEHVQVIGARHLAPDQVVAMSGIDEHSTLFDDFAPWVASLERHPVVLRATIQRRLRNVVTIEIVESEPVALVRANGLRPADARGRLLPIEPGALETELPLVAGAARIDSLGRITDAATLAAIEVLARIRQSQPDLISWISALEPMTGGVRLRLRSPPGAEILVPRAPEPRRLQDLNLAIADLAARDHQPDQAPPLRSGELSRLIRIDVRYRDQIVVELANTRAREAS